MALIWTLTDGKAGDALQCLGVAETVIARIGGSLVEHKIAPRALYALAMPWGPADPADLTQFAPPWPDVAIASGRRAVTYLRWLKKRSPGTLTGTVKPAPSPNRRLCRKISRCSGPRRSSRPSSDQAKARDVRRLARWTGSQRTKLRARNSSVQPGG